MFVAPLQMPGGIIALVVLLIVIVGVSQAVEIVKRTLAVFGEFRRILEPGINFVPPSISENHVFDMRTQTLDVPSQEAIT